MNICDVIVPVSGRAILVDQEDLLIINARAWWIDREGYVRSNAGSLHRILTNAPPFSVVDHIDGDKKNNCRRNLRICTQQQNLWNGRPHRDGTSKYRGVSWNRRLNKWRVQIQGESLGFYADEDAAALAYNAEAMKRFGDFARPNVVPGAGIEPARAQAQRILSP